MKKETIEKVFKRYISIFDDVVNKTTGKHLDKTVINEINSEVDLIFKEYEQMNNLVEFNTFSKKILEIINKVILKTDNINKDLIYEKIKKELCIFESEPFVYIQKEIDDTVSKIIPDSKGDYYIPYNPYLDSIVNNKGYRINFESAKIKDHIENIKAKYDVEKEKMIQQNKEEYDRILKKTLKEINDFPIQFCEETINKYFYNKWFDKLILFKNSMKNRIIIDAINTGLKPHTEEYENAVDLNLIFKPEVSYPVDQLKYGNDIKNSFIYNHLVSRSKIINDFYEIYNNVYYNKGLTTSQKINLKRKFNIVSNNIDNIYDISFIRVHKFALEHNLYNLYKDFLTNESNRLLAYNTLNIILTLLINELKTIKLENSDFVLNEKYVNIINEYYKYIEDNKINEQNRGNVGNPILKISILDSFIDKFNKQFKYKYIVENIKSKFKNIIKIKK